VNPKCSRMEDFEYIFLQIFPGDDVMVLVLKMVDTAGTSEREE